MDSENVCIVLAHHMGGFFRLQVDHYDVPLRPGITLISEIINDVVDDFCYYHDNQLITSR